jgi:segregation and condensation protein B
MSLKAKLEAVIYAAEEPVTLAQLAALFAADAFEWKAQQEAALAKQAADAASEAAQSLPPASEEAAFLELELEPVDSDPSEPVSVAAAEQIPVVEQVPVMGQASAVEPMPGASREAGLEAGPDSRADCRVDSTVDFRVGSSADSGSKPDVEAFDGRGPEANPEPEPETNLDASQTAGFSAPPECADAPTSAEDGPEPAKDPSKLAGDAPEPAEDSAAIAELEARREARLRDREVRAILRQILDELVASCASDDRGVEIREIAGGYRMATKPECHDAVRLFVKSLKPVLKLSLPALETLAVIAYKQPVTAPEVNEIRGVDSSGVFGSLLARKLISTAGRKQVVGRPILYKTTREFLLRFGLKDLSELPSMEEFEKMAVLSLDETESATGEEPERRSNPALGPEFDEAASEELEDSPSEGLHPQAASQAAAPASEEPSAGLPAISAEPTPEKAAPAAPSPLEQAETETLPHGE